MDTGELLRHLGQRIRDLRERRGWSQEELARRADRHFTYIGRIERGEQNVTVEVLFEVARALDTTPDQLLIVDPPKLLANWGVTANDIVEALSHGFRAQVDIKGKVAELMLYRELSRLRVSGEIDSLEWLDEDGKPDFIVGWQGRRIIVECKNVRSVGAGASASAMKVELQKTRNSKDGTLTRGYTIAQFDVLSACLFNRTGRWTFLHVASRHLATRPKDPNFLVIMQNVPSAPGGVWRETIKEAIRDTAR